MLTNVAVSYISENAFTTVNNRVRVTMLDWTDRILTSSMCSRIIWRSESTQKSYKLQPSSDSMCWFNV